MLINLEEINIAKTTKSVLLREENSKKYDTFTK